MDTVIVYKDRSHRWRWHRIAANGRIVSDSGQSFRRKWNCTRSARRTNRDVPVTDQFHHEAL